MISPKLFQKNRKKLFNKLRNNSIAVVNAQDQMFRNGDQFFPYRQNSDFYYLTGIKQEKSVLVLYKGANEGEVEEYLFIMQAQKELETWEGHKLSKEEAHSVSGIEKVFYLADLEHKLHALAHESSFIYVNIFENARFKPEQTLRDERFFDQLREWFPVHRYERLSPILQKLRLIKETEEIEQIKKAIEITSKAYKRIENAIKDGVYEFQVAADITHEFLLNGAWGHAFEPIVAGGKNACVLHYVTKQDKLNNGDLVLLDFGAEYNCYAGDCSRTIPVNGKMTNRQKELYQAVYDVFVYARSLMKPGTTINEMHKKVCGRWQEEHIKLGLYSKEDVKNQDENSPLWRKYYMHGTSHFMGLDVHDVGTKETIFEPGMVLTCEPGIYIEEEGIGIRLENDILITEGGNIDLMEDIPFLV